jgi:hypothetical protein
MQKIISTLLLILIACITNAQELKNNLYYYKGAQIELPINYNTFYVASYTSQDVYDIFDGYGYNIDSLQGGIHNDSRDSAIHWKVVKINNADLDLTSYNLFRTLLKTDHSDLIVEACVGDTMPRAISNYFYVKLKQASDTTLLDSMAAETNAVVLKGLQYVPLWYELKADTNSIGNSLELSNLFYETELFADISPGFIMYWGTLCSGITDPLFSQQQPLQNTTNPNLDINACQAWGITKGSSSIKVAVVDEGLYVPWFAPPGDYDDPIAAFDAEIGAPVSINTPDYGPHGRSLMNPIRAKHNTTGLSGLAPNVKCLDVRHSLAFNNPLRLNSAAELANGIGWAVAQGADVINNSWGDNNQAPFYPILHHAVLENAILNAIHNGRNGKGTVVVFAAGNNNTVMYPSNFTPEILTVSGINASGQLVSGISHGRWLDIVAPVDNNEIGTTPPYNLGPTTSSYAAPFASGTAALALSANPCMSGEDVRVLIESTAQKLSSYQFNANPEQPSGTWSPYVGHGLVDAYAVVKGAQDVYNANADLYMKDQSHDLGIEPNPYTGPDYHISPDIWIRRTNDGGLTHENPVGGQINWIYIRIRNKGCATSAIAELKLWITPAGTNLPFPGGWTDITQVANIPIPAIDGGEEYIIKYLWIPNFNFVSGDLTFINGSVAYHHCLLASINDNPIPNPSSNVMAAVRASNSVIQKNITIIGDDLYSGIVNFRPMSGGSSDPISLKFKVPDAEMNATLIDEAEIRIRFDNHAWDKWQSTDKIADGLTVIDETLHEFLVTQAEATIYNIPIDSTSLIEVSFNFLTEEVTDKQQFNYDLYQLDGNDIIGGERFVVNKPPREEEMLFRAEANSYNALSGSGKTVEANDICETASYKWYTTDTSLVDTGRCINLNPAQNTTYLLEVTAQADGYKDYAEVNVPGTPQSYISSLNPNPATGQVTCTYHIDSAVQNAQIKITLVNNPSIQSTYNININQSQASLNLGTLPNGIYTVNLLCDNQIIDSKQLVIQ